MAFFAANACNRLERVPTRRSPLLASGETIVAVGSRSLRATEFGRIYRESGLAPDVFAERWASDALLANAARGGAIHSSRIAQVERSVLARALMHSIFESAQRMGEPTEQELQAARAEHWPEVDRPVASQTTHLVVLQRSGQDSGRAEALARALAQAVRTSRTPAEFKGIVERYPKNGLEVIVESLPPVTPDGKSLRIDANGEVTGAGPPFDTVFARAANLLATPGEQSGIVRTEFGFHVILLERKIPASFASTAELKERFASEINSRRAREAVDKSLREARRDGVAIESSFQEAIAQLQVVQ